MMKRFKGINFLFDYYALLSEFQVTNKFIKMSYFK